MSERQLTFDGVEARCEYVDATALPYRNEPCVLACVLAPHDGTVAHVLEWRELPVPPFRPVIVKGGLL